VRRAGKRKTLYLLACYIGAKNTNAENPQPAEGETLWAASLNRPQLTSSWQ
jgi:hypothetical protein